MIHHLLQWVVCVYYYQASAEGILSGKKAALQLFNVITKMLQVNRNLCMNRN